MGNQTSILRWALGISLVGLGPWHGQNLPDSFFGVLLSTALPGFVGGVLLRSRWSVLLLPAVFVAGEVVRAVYAAGWARTLANDAAIIGQEIDRGILHFLWWALGWAMFLFFNLFWYVAGLVILIGGPAALGVWLGSRFESRMRAPARLG